MINIKEIRFSIGEFGEEVNIYEESVYLHYGDLRVKVGDGIEDLKEFRKELNNVLKVIIKEITQLGTCGDLRNMSEKTELIYDGENIIMGARVMEESFNLREEHYTTIGNGEWEYAYNVRRNDNEVMTTWDKDEAIEEFKRLVSEEVRVLD